MDACCGVLTVLLCVRDNQCARRCLHVPSMQHGDGMLDWAFGDVFPDGLFYNVGYILGNGYHLYSTHWRGGRLPLSDIKFTQNCIRPRFSDTKQNLMPVITHVRHGLQSPDYFLPMRVGWYKESWYSLDNRRLYVLKEACDHSDAVITLSHKARVHFLWPINTHEHHDPRCFGDDVTVSEDTTSNMRYLGRGEFQWQLQEDRIVGSVTQELR